MSKRVTFQDVEIIGIGCPYMVFCRACKHEHYYLGLNRPEVCIKCGNQNPAA